MPQPTCALDRLHIAMATLSVGRATQHELKPKLAAIANAGFSGVEVFYEDIKLPAKRLHGSFEENLLDVCRYFRSLCDSYGLQVTCLQPFKNYDGLLSAKRHAEKLTKLRVWLKMAKILGTDLIMVPSMFHTDPSVSTGDEATLVADLQELADIGAAQRPPVRFAYENMAWGAHVSTWQDAWRIVKKANRPNLGLCLDSFQVLASFWGDPTATDGRYEGADLLLTRDCEELLTSVPLEKVFYVQIADGVRLDKPLSSSHAWYDEQQHPTLTWSRNGRLFPGEESLGAYLPVFELLKTWLVDLGYRGFIGFEVFNKDLFRADASVPAEYAQRGMRSWRKCVEVLQLDSLPDTTVDYFALREPADSSLGTPRL